MRHETIHQVLPYQAIGTSTHRLTFGIVSLGLLILDLPYAIQEGSVWQVHLLCSVTVAAALALTGWFPFIGGVLFAAALLTTAALPGTYTIIVFLWLGCYAVAADWISRGWYRGAAVYVVFLDGVEIAISSARVVSLVQSIIGVAIAVAIGLSLQWNRSRLKRMDEEADSIRQSAAEAEETLRKDIATGLHSAVLGELTSIVLTTRRLIARDNPTVSSEELIDLEAMALAASSQLRTLVHTVTPTAGHQPSLTDLLNASETMLNSRSITMVADYPGSLDQGLSVAHRAFLAIFLREASVNVIKYAPENSSASLSIEYTDDEGIGIMMTNSILSTNLMTDGIAGGFGLHDLAERAAAIGGVIDYGPLGNTWLLTAHFPCKGTPS